MARGDSPTVRQRQLAAMLRRLREESALTIEEAATRLRASSSKWSKSKLSRVENRQQRVQPAEVGHLLDLYEVYGDRRDSLMEMAKKAMERGWWVAYGSALPESFQTYVGLESAATTIRQFEIGLMPGLLQTPDYAYAMMLAGEPGTPADVQEGRVAARMARQRVLHREDPVEYRVILDEGVLRRTVGGVRVMKGQLERLLELTRLPNISIQVVPFDVGSYPGMDGPFTILELPQPDDIVVYVEGPAGAVYLEDAHSLRRSTMQFGQISAVALESRESVKLISQFLKEYQ
ncbi:XRE family transcriptional regulator [Pseudonocardiaceae bacterium YIM PH 21723]|nr:XRE family transcriptional regulator [Pseudonocardiaceae bacterium YIM PH 21723]